MQPPSHKFRIGLNVALVILAIVGYVSFDYVPSWMTALTTLVLFFGGCWAIYLNYRVLRGRPEQ